jgi:hypothetical protein
MGIDRNGNGVPDGDEPPPPLTTARSESAVLISWPSGAGGVVLAFKPPRGTVSKSPFPSPTNIASTGCANCSLEGASNAHGAGGLEGILGARGIFYFADGIDGR